MRQKYHENGKIAALDGLRAVAAILVFGVHFQQISGFDPRPLEFFNFKLLLLNGNAGVSIFFSLSGFLLSMPFWRAQIENRGGINTREYLVRRIARIVPAYYLCLTVLLFWNGAIFERDEFLNILTHYAFVFNYWESFFYDYNPPFWTIAIEVQFYLILPILFVLLRQMGKTWAPIAIFIIIIFATLIQFKYFLNEGAMLAKGRHISVTATHSLLAHLPHFLIGVLAARYSFRAFYHQRLVMRQARLFDGIFLIACGLFVACIGTELGSLLSPAKARYFFPLLSILIAIVLICILRGYWSGKLLGVPLFKYLGVISYGIYLFHYPVLRLLEKVMSLFALTPQTNVLIFAVVGFLSTTLIAAACYHFVEFPIRRKFNRMNRG